MVVSSSSENVPSPGEIAMDEDVDDDVEDDDVGMDDDDVGIDDDDVDDSDLDDGEDSSFTGGQPSALCQESGGTYDQLR